MINELSPSGNLNYKINNLTNVIELRTDAYNLTVPDKNHNPSDIMGTWKAGSYGWWVFIEPLPPGDYLISYHVHVTSTGPVTSPGTTDHFADNMEYLFEVK